MRAALGILRFPYMISVFVVQGCVNIPASMCRRCRNPWRDNEMRQERACLSPWLGEPFFSSSLAGLGMQTREDISPHRHTQTIVCTYLCACESVSHLYTYLHTYWRPETTWWFHMRFHPLPVLLIRVWKETLVIETRTLQVVFVYFFAFIRSSLFVVLFCRMIRVFLFAFCLISIPHFSSDLLFSCVFHIFKSLPHFPFLLFLFFYSVSRMYIIS